MPADTPLRLCLTMRRFPPRFAGHGIQMARTLPFLEALGIETTVLTAALPDAPQEEEIAGGRVRRLLPAGEGLRGIARRAHATPSLWAEQSADVFHVMPDWEFALGIPALKRRGVGVVTESVLLGSDDPASIARGRLGRTRLARLARADAWIAISRHFEPHFRAAGLLNRHRLVYPGCDTDRYRMHDPRERAALRDALDLPVRARVVVSVGSVIERKGMDRALEAWAACAPQPGRDILVLIGPKSAEEGLSPRNVAFSEDLQQRASGPGLAGTVRFAGRSSRVEHYLGAADAFLFLSRREGFGTVTAEAMACGLPVVVSPLGGIGDELTDEGGCGAVARAPDDPRAVAALIEGALSGGDALRAQGRRARERAERLFSLRARANGLAEIYREAVRGTSVSS